ncbi:hypothetical protein JW613_27505 [Streptomyces smyrnaeus]|uniref:Secreted protein n=1 Tax=Streptomyces smyrnaeus TaxID=1387713 RepID=A0ABS3Y3E0_9ACTN|nr:hypothetical protein [Streptomyces smyrnaeus]MBO8202013.1 hypothetical protein [Streptomyces smyrnaeus]
MDALVTVAVVIAMIALGVLLIHRLNAQHDQRIAAFRYGAALPVRRSRRRKRRRPADSAAGHHDGNRE